MGKKGIGRGATAGSLEGGFSLAGRRPGALSDTDGGTQYPEDERGTQAAGERVLKWGAGGCGPGQAMTNHGG